MLCVADHAVQIKGSPNNTLQAMCMRVVTICRIRLCYCPKILP